MEHKQTGSLIQGRVGEATGQPLALGNQLGLDTPVPTSYLASSPKPRPLSHEWLCFWKVHFNRRMPFFPVSVLDRVYKVIPQGKQHSEKWLNMEDSEAVGV